MTAGVLAVEDHHGAALLRRMRDDVEPGVRAAIGQLPGGVRPIGG